MSNKDNYIYLEKVEQAPNTFSKPSVLSFSFATLWRRLLCKELFSDMYQNGNSILCKGSKFDTSTAFHHTQQHNRYSSTSLQRPRIQEHFLRCVFK
jgi:hypothetical protein